MLIKYKTFYSSEEFEKFQEENTINIISVSPLVSGINLSEEQLVMRGDAEIAVFVVYCNHE